MPSRIQDYEIHIPGFMPLTSNDDLNLLGFTILRAICSSINLHEITNVRLLNISDEHTLQAERSSGADRLFISFIIRLTSVERARQIMFNRRNINYFSTRDLNKTLLSEELVSRMPFSKIFVNETLSSTEYKSFKSLKNIGKNIGFKFIWHCGGKFLARWRLGAPEHYFSNHSDLNRIKNSYASDTYQSPVINKEILPPNLHKKWLEPSFTKDALKVGFINATSLKMDICQFKEILTDDSTYDVVGVAETHLGNKVDDHLININGYNTIRQDRKTEGGGIILYVRNTLRATILAKSNTEMAGKPLQVEFLMCRICGTGTPPFFVCLIYRPPRISFTDNPDFLTNLCDCCSSYSHKVIMGDLNDDLMFSSDDHFTKKLTNELSLKIVKHGPTHRPAGSNAMKTWIDVMLIDSNDTILSHNNTVPPFHSRHNLIDVTIKLFIPKPPSETF